MKTTPEAKTDKTTQEESDHYEHVGAYLRDLRQKYELTIEEVASRLHIRPKYITALEEGNMEDMPGKVYTIGYLQHYAEFLGLNAKEILEKYTELNELDSQRTFRIVQPTGEQNAPSYKLILSIAALVIMGVLVWQFSKRATQNPDIRVDEVPLSIIEKLEAKLVITPANKNCLNLKQQPAYPPCYPANETYTAPFLLKPARNMMELATR